MGVINTQHQTVNAWYRLCLLTKKFIRNTCKEKLLMFKKCEKTDILLLRYTSTSQRACASRPSYQSEVNPPYFHVPANKFRMFQMPCKSLLLSVLIQNWTTNWQVQTSEQFWYVWNIKHRKTKTMKRSIVPVASTWPSHMLTSFSLPG